MKDETSTRLKIFMILKLFKKTSLIYFYLSCECLLYKTSILQLKIKAWHGDCCLKNSSKLDLQKHGNQETSKICKT